MRAEVIPCTYVCLAFVCLKNFPITLWNFLVSPGQFIKTVVQVTIILLFMQLYNYYSEFICKALFEVEVFKNTIPRGQKSVVR